MQEHPQAQGAVAGPHGDETTTFTLRLPVRELEDLRLAADALQTSVAAEIRISIAERLNRLRMDPDFLERVRGYQQRLQRLMDGESASAPIDGEVSAEA